MADLPAPALRWYHPRRWWGWLSRGTVATERPTEVTVGADFARETLTAAPYDVQAAMSAYGEFAWIVAACNAIASDLSRLPIRASIGRGRKAKILEDHPVLALVRRPTSRARGLLFRRQRILDLLLAGYSIAPKVYPARGGPPSSILRWHPYRARILPGPDGQPLAYEFNAGTGGGGSSQRLDWRAVIHVSQMSWEDTPAALYGQGLVRPLRRELNIDLALQRRLETSAKKGRPDIILTPGGNDAAAALPPGKVTEFRRELEELFTSTAGGAVLLGRKLDVEKLGWSPTDLGVLEQRGFTRATILAVTGVPPVRVGLETANYATAQQQAETYWGDVLQGIAALEDEAWTELAREFPDSDDVEVWHDFSDVPALQGMQSMRLGRVTTHILNGMDPADAYDYEGLGDAPIARAPPAEEPAPPAEEPGKGGAVLTVARWIAPDDGPLVTEWIDGSVVRVAEVPAPAAVATADADVEKQRAQEWRTWARRVHLRHEIRIGRATRAALRAQLARIDSRLDAQKASPVGLARDLADDLVRNLWLDSEEDEALRQALRKVVRDALGGGYQEGVRRVARPDLVFDPIRLDVAVDEVLGSLVKNVNDTTILAVRASVRSTIAGGGTIADIQRELQGLPEFGPSRALLVGRTESTRSVNAGSLRAYEEAVHQGVAMRLEWLSSRDSSVRPTHLAADGQIIDVGGLFVLADGDSGTGPGAMSRPENICNCRCTVVPVLDDEE